MVIASILANDDPFANVNVCWSKNGLLLSNVELNSKVAFFVPSPPDLVKKGTVITESAAVLVPVPLTTSSLPSAVFYPEGNVAPVAAIAIVPVPSDEIVAPAKSIESDER